MCKKSLAASGFWYERGLNRVAAYSIFGVKGRGLIREADLTNWGWSLHRNRAQDEGKYCLAHKSRSSFKQLKRQVKPCFRIFTLSISLASKLFSFRRLKTISQHFPNASAQWDSNFALKNRWILELKKNPKRHCHPGPLRTCCTFRLSENQT